MWLPGPHVFLQITLVEAVAVGGFLGAFHDLAEFVGGKLGPLAALEDFLLEQVTRIDVHDDLRSGVQLGLQHGQFFLWVADLGQHGFGGNRLTEGGGGLGQGHGRELL